MAKIKKAYALVLVTILLAFSCETEVFFENTVQEKILMDQEFIDLMATNLTKNFKSSTIAVSDDEREFKNNLKTVVNRLEKRYEGFDKNARLALENTTDANYYIFAQKLSKAVSALKNLQQNRSYDAESVCGNPCKDTNASNITLSCIVGCSYSELYCMNNGGVNCSAMMSSCRGYCCDRWCPDPKSMGL